MVVALSDLNIRPRPGYPKWVNRYRNGLSARRPLIPQQRRYSGHSGTSGLCHERTQAPQQTTALFDHLVGGGEERWRKGDAEGSGGLQIDHHVKLGRRLHRQVGRLLAAEDAPDIAGRAPQYGGSILQAE